MKLYVVGGFLGSGKTTAIRQACAALQADGRKAAVLTNDQGAQLVDTGYIRSFGIPVREVTNGCFCCNYDQMAGGILQLAEAVQPEVIFAEPVGSCTDLVATIAKPIEAAFPSMQVAVSVFADAALVLSLISGTASFLDETVQYIYKKQLEEADVLVINKIDLLEPQELERVKEVITSEYGRKTLLFQNSLEEESIRQWLQTLEKREQQNRASLDIDYDVYAAGEAKLAWLDQTATIRSPDGRAVEAAHTLAHRIYTKISEASSAIGHLKFLVNDGKEDRKISYTTVNRDGAAAPAGGGHTKATILINARVQTEPEQLAEIVRKAVEEVRRQYQCLVALAGAPAFQPGYPRPTHRIGNEQHSGS